MYQKKIQKNLGKFPSILPSPCPWGSFISFQNDSSEPRRDFDLRRSRDLRQGAAFTLRQGAPTSRLDHGTWSRWVRPPGKHGASFEGTSVGLGVQQKKEEKNVNIGSQVFFMEFVDN